jgi:hypothetical protein
MLTISNLEKKESHDQLYLLSGGVPHSGRRRGLFPPDHRGANTFAWREKMKARLLGKTRSALMLLMFVTAQTHFSAQAQSVCPPPATLSGGQHPTLLASYAKRPLWKVAGVDYAVGVPSMATLTDWQLLSGPGITVIATNVPPYVRVDNTSNVVISGVDFSLHGGADIRFNNSPNPTVTNSKFGGPNLTKNMAAVIYADFGSPGLTVSYNTIDGGGAGSGSTLVGAAGAGVTTLTYNWLKNFPQHVLEMLVNNSPYALTYKYNLIEKGGSTVGAHMNFLQFGGNVNSVFVDVENNTVYQTWQATGGEGFQFGSYGTGLVKNVTFAYNVMIAVATPANPKSISVMIHANGIENSGNAHDNYADLTGAYFWLYYGSFTGWNVRNNYNMTTGAILPAS